MPEMSETLEYIRWEKYRGCCNCVCQMLFRSLHTTKNRCLLTLNAILCYLEEIIELYLNCSYFHDPFDLILLPACWCWFYVFIYVHFWQWTFF